MSSWRERDELNSLTLRSLATSRRDWLVVSLCRYYTDCQSAS